MIIRMGPSTACMQTWHIPNLRTYLVVIEMLSMVQMKLNSTELCHLFELQLNGVIAKS